MALYANGHKIAPVTGITPTGTISITENGTYDVIHSAVAEVQVPQGWRATIAVSTEPGATVTYLTQSVEADESGNATVYAYEEGTANVTSTLGELSNTGQVHVYGAYSYSLSIPLTSTIVVNTLEGAEVTCNEETKTVGAEGSVSFTVTSTGTYEVVATLDGYTITKSVSVLSLGQRYSVDIVFVCYITIYTNNGADVIYNGLRKTATNGSVLFKLSSVGTHKFLFIHNGNSLIKDITISSLTDRSEYIYIIPNAYKQVEYLKSDGYSWIDTGIATDISKNCKMKARTMIFNSNRCVVIGSYASGSTSSISIEYGGTSSGYPRKAPAWLGSGGGAVLGTLFVDRQSTINTINDCEFNWTPATKTLSISMTENGVKYSKSEAGTLTYPQSGASTLMLFSDHRSDKSTISTPLAIYSCEVYVNDVLSANFIPCKRVSDSVLGMYDAVNDVFYTNSGTGTFTAGSDVSSDAFYLPSEYTYRKYVANTSDKTQYLDLGEIGTNTSGILIKVYEETTTAPKDNIFCGGRTTQNGRFWIGANQTNASQLDYIYYGWNTLNRLDNPPIINATHTLRTAYVNYLNNRQQGYDNTKAFDLNQTLVQSTPLYAFAAYNNTSVALNSWCRLYYIVLTSGTNISNIFIPCYRNSDNVIGMYDIVKGNFKTNAGSGTFVDGGYLPSTYQQVEYIQSDGNQYILTGIIPEDNTIIDMKFNYLRASDWLFLGSSDETTMLFVQRNRFVAGFRSDDRYIDFNPIISANEDAELHINLATNGGTMTVSGSKSGSVIRNGNLPNSELILFGRNYSGAVALSAMKLYSFAIRGQNNNHSLVPCYRKSDNVVGMYDVKNMRFYTNDGTGSFTAGPDVN